MKSIIGGITATMAHLLVCLLVFLLAAGNCLAAIAREDHSRQAPNLSAQPHRQTLKISTQIRQENRENKRKCKSDIAYDADGSRVSKTVGTINAQGAYVGTPVTTFYLVDTNSLTGYAQVVEELQGGEVVRQYTYGLDLISQRQKIGGNFVTHWYGSDGHGSVRFLTDSTGTVTDTLDYDAFGILINQTGTTPNNYLYAGEQFDHDLQLYYNRARYLNVNTGRFFTQDTFEGDIGDPASLHKYLYANADPVNGLDPSGNLTLVEKSLVVFAALTIAAFAAQATLLNQQRIRPIPFQFPDIRIPTIPQARVDETPAPTPEPEPKPQPEPERRPDPFTLEDTDNFGRNIVFRAIRHSENPLAGLFATDPTANETLTNHILQGGRADFKSQFISTTRSIFVAQRFARFEGRRIVAIDLKLVTERIYDLTTSSGRNKYLKGFEAKRLAKQDEEVTVEKYIPPNAIVGQLQ